MIGPVTEQQFRTMARQQWFRITDQVSIAADGPWVAARSVIPATGFNSEGGPREPQPVGTMAEPDNATAEPAWTNRLGDSSVSTRCFTGC